VPRKPYKNENLLIDTLQIEKILESLSENIVGRFKSEITKIETSLGHFPSLTIHSVSISKFRKVFPWLNSCLFSIIFKNIWEMNWCEKLFEKMRENRGIFFGTHIIYIVSYYSCSGNHYSINFNSKKTYLLAS